MFMGKIFVQAIGITILIGILVVAIFVAGAVLGAALSVAIPVLALFTGVLVIRFLLTDFSK
jgi:hypothetical protein